MYRLLFDDDTMIEVQGYKGLQMGLAGFNGKNPPKYMYLWFKSKYFEKSQLLQFESSLQNKKLRSVFTYTEDGQELKNAVPVPDNYLGLKYEEGDLITEYGNSLYYDECY